MKETATAMSGKHPDVPLAAGVLVAGAVALVFFWLRSPRTTEMLALRLARFGEINATPLLAFSALFLSNVIWIGVAAKRHAKSVQDNQRGLSQIKGGTDPSIISLIVKRVAAYVLACGLGWYGAAHQLALSGWALLPANRTSNSIGSPGPRGRTRVFLLFRAAARFLEAISRTA